MLAKRIITGLTLALGSIALVIWVPDVFLIEICVIAVLGLKELFTLAGGTGNPVSKPLTYINIIAAVLYFAGIYFFRETQLFYLMTFIMLVLLASNIFINKIPQAAQTGKFLCAPVGVFGFLYIPFLISFLLLIRKIEGTFFIGPLELDAGACFVVYLIAITAFCDTGAFFIGRYFGKNKLCPAISPGKTIEGSLGGMVCSITIAYLLGKFMGLQTHESILIGLVLSIAAQVGDLFESLIKREAGVKDSGNLLAGHGGILDRFDSYFFTAPLMYILLKVFILP